MKSQADGERDTPRGLVTTRELSTTRRNPRYTFFVGFFLSLVGILALLAVLSPQFFPSASADIVTGGVASQDILANQDITYTSQVLTEQKREEAGLAVGDIFTLPDTSIARQQVDMLRNSLAYITSVRSDVYADTNQKMEDLIALDKIQIRGQVVENILALNEIRWQAVEQEAVSALEQIMRLPIRPATLEQARSTVPAMISLALSPTQAEIVAEFVQASLTSNSFFSEDLTQAARETARQSVEPVKRSYVVGQTVIRRGEVLDSGEVEALEQLGLATPKKHWQDYIGAVTLVSLMASFLLLYLWRTPTSHEQMRNYLLISFLLLIFLFGVRLTSYGHVVLPYAFPIAGFSLLIAAMFGAKIAMVATIPLAIMASYGMPNALDLTIYYILGSLFGVLALGRARRISSFIWAGAAVTFAGWMVLLTYRLNLPSTDWAGLLTLFSASLINGLASATLALLLQYFLAQLLGTTTPMQLMDLTRPDQPLLQFILQQAPGTYQHSLQVANLAEQAADRIGADTLLTRVGSLYHDGGKASNPIFFIENQLPGFDNPHNELDPEGSAAIIIRHVADGIKLARTYRLPKRIEDFITEHHGTTLTRYQYSKAVTAAGGDESRVDKTCFRYPGPKPGSKETAILMLADAAEARVRAERPPDEEQLHALIKMAINQRVSEGELDETEVSLRDLDLIADSFTKTLRGLYHPRIQYPQVGQTQPIEHAAGLPAVSGGRQDTGGGLPPEGGLPPGGEGDVIKSDQTDSKPR